MDIGFLGFGEAASNIAKGFREEENLDLYGYDVMLTKSGEEKGLVYNRMKETGVVPVSDPESLLKCAKVIFLVIPAKYAKNAALDVLPYMTSRHLFCDLTTNAPEIKEELGETFESHGYLYADASVMGAVPIYRHKTPIVVSGNGAQQMVKKLSTFGMKLRNVGSEPGKAVRIKLTRSVFVKGVEALTMETLMTARSQGIEDEIVDGIEESFRNLGFTGFCGQLVRSGVIHSERRSLEARECRDLEESLGLDATMMEASYHKLHWLDTFGLAKRRPNCESLEDLYCLWEDAGIVKKRY